MPDSTTPQITSLPTLKKPNGLKIATTPNADFRRFKKMGIPLNVRRLVEFSDLQEEMGIITKRASNSVKKPHQIEVKHEFFLVDTADNDVVRVHKGQTIGVVLQGTNTCENTRIKHLVRITCERPSKGLFRRWKHKYFDVLTSPYADSFKDFVDRLRNTHRPMNME